MKEVMVLRPKHNPFRAVVKESDGETALIEDNDGRKYRVPQWQIKAIDEDDQEIVIPGLDEIEEIY